jgi:DNA-binding HxlR family transcriptional regulator
MYILVKVAMKAAQKKSASAPRATPLPRVEPSRPQAAPMAARPPDVAAMVESIIGCKWSLHVLAQIRSGINRPGVLTRSAPGLTTKVLNERLDKMLQFGIIARQAFPEIPPRVEYTLTPFGERFAEILDAVERLKNDAATGQLAEDRQTQP